MSSAIGSAKHCLSASGLNPLIRRQLDKIEDSRQQDSIDYTLTDTLNVGVRDVSKQDAFASAVRE